jgi:hypothetical protein
MFIYIYIYIYIYRVETGPQQTHNPQNYQNPAINTAPAENKPEEAPLSLLQKLANMLEKAKK